MSPYAAIRPWLQLVRLPAVFSAWSNILAAHLIATGGDPEWRLLGLQIGISSALYWGGMALNDCFDLAEDRRERPDRPLPAGRVPVAAAWALGLGLLALALLLGLASGETIAWIAVLLAAAVLLYDGVLKHRILLGPAVMGLCRYLNWLLGLAATPISATGLVLPLPVLLYTAGVSVLSGMETGGGSPLRLVGTQWLLAGAALAVVGLHLGGIQPQPLGLLGLAALTAFVGARLRQTFARPEPGDVQRGVKVLLLGMIALDGVLVLGDGQWVAAGGLLLLLIPGRMLARRLYIT